jgi:SAM-dependent methyltransferase
LYERHAAAYDRDRGRYLQERAWLDRFLAHVPERGTILDVGCGMGEPLARYFIDRGFAVFGVDASPAMIALCRARFPESEWLVADMRSLELSRRFDGILAWDSTFHLCGDDQRAMIPRFAAHAAEGAPLLFTSGTEDGERIGSYQGEPLYHASLAPEEYSRLMAATGFTVRSFVAEDLECGGHTVWLATFGL